jgi:hypothetical protein
MRSGSSWARGSSAVRSPLFLVSITGVLETNRALAPGATSLEDAASDADQLAAEAIASSTRRASESDFQDFTAWRSEFGLDPLPATPQTVSAYLASLVREKPPRRDRRDAQAGRPESPTSSDRPGGEGQSVPIPKGREIRPVAALDAWIPGSGHHHGPNKSGNVQPRPTERAGFREHAEGEAGRRRLRSRRVLRTLGSSRVRHSSAPSRA